MSPSSDPLAPASTDGGFWRGRRVLVTGGTGFIGSFLAEQLVQAGARVRIATRLQKSSLDAIQAIRDRVELVVTDLSESKNCLAVCDGQEIVMNLVAKLTGIGYNVGHHGEMFFRNALPALQMLEAARIAGVDRFLVVSSACVYPREATVPTPETEGGRLDPEPTNFGYGWAKRVAEVQARAYQQEYDMKISIVRPYNAYGPRDDFEWETSHVIPALIRKVHERSTVEVWGDGSQRRSFIHARDVARGMMLAVERDPGIHPLNLGSTELVRLSDLVTAICRVSDRFPPIVYSASAPSGQDVRLPDMTETLRRVGFRAEIGIEEGLAETVAWYRTRFG